MKVKERIKNYIWKKNNKHNHTDKGYLGYVDFKNVVVGRASYGQINANFDKHGKDASKLFIGNYCSIAPKVRFIVCSDHMINTLSSYPFKSSIYKDNEDAKSKGDIILEDDVWIGYRAIILSGVHIGQGAVVAAGAVVTKDVPPYAVVGGVPAKIIKYRFNEEIIDYMLSLDYSQLTKELIGSHIDDLYQPINEKSLDEIKKIFEWFPKKHNS